MSDVLAAAVRRLAVAGVAEPRRDARVLLAAALDWPVVALVTCPEREVGATAGAAFEAMIAERARRKPVSRIVGRREFWSLPFAIDDATLDPRPDSETLVAAVLEGLQSKDAPLRILDLGTGSGCLLLALLSECRNALGVGLDRSPGAVRAARANAQALGLGARAGFVAGDWAAPLAGRFDVVVANPPYVSEPEMATLAPEVACHDPPQALRAGADGLDAYRALVPALPRLLAADGLAAIEVGAGQAGEVARMLEAAGLTGPKAIRDLVGFPRCLLVASPPVSDHSDEKTVGNIACDGYGIHIGALGAPTASAGRAPRDPKSVRARFCDLGGGRRLKR